MGIVRISKRRDNARASPQTYLETAMSVSNGKAPHELRRVLRFGDSVAVMVGIIVGSGIFRTPSTVAEQLQSPGAIYAIWIIGGAHSALRCIDVCRARVGLATNRGNVRLSTGMLRPCSPAFCSVGPNSSSSAHPVSLRLPMFLRTTWGSLCHCHQPASSWLRSWVSWPCDRQLHGRSGYERGSECSHDHEDSRSCSSSGRPFRVPAFTDAESIPVVLPLNWSTLQWAGLALIGVYWTYDGWTEITSVAGEVVDPQRTIPRALIAGTIVVLGLYLSVNWAFLHILGPADMAASKRVATDAMVLALGPMGGSIIAIGVIVATLGALTGTMLTGPRVFFAMAIDGIFFSWAKRVHPHYRTPSTAIVLQALVAVPLVLAWEFVELTTYFVFMSLIFYSLGTAAVFRLRRSDRSRDAVYRTWLYPIPPLFFLLVASGILINTVAGFPLQALIAVLILLAGVPVYYWWRGIKNRSSVLGSG